MGCGEFLVKCILFVSNFIFAAAGLALLGVGVAVQLQTSAALELMDGRFAAAPVLSMVVGGVVFLIAFFGCCGAIRESRCMLITYASLLIVLMVAKVVLASLLFVHLSDLGGAIDSVLDSAFTNNNDHVFNALEAGLQCCGTRGPLSYGIRPLPPSCCGMASDSGNPFTCNPLNAYQRGCNAVLTDVLQTFAVAVGAVAIAVVAVELVAVVFALCLANHAANKHRRTHY